MALLALGLLLSSWNTTLPLQSVFAALAHPAFATVGALIAARRAAHPIGWLFCAIALVLNLGLFADQYAEYTLVTAPSALPGGVWMAWLGSWIIDPAWALMVPLLLLLFPTGRLPSSHWRPVAWFLIGGNVAATAATLAQPFAPGPFEKVPSISNPIGMARAAGVLRVIHSLLPLLFGAMIAAAVSMVLRFRRAQGEERQQLKWVAYAAALMISGLGVVYLITHSVNSPAVELSADVLAALLFAAFPTAVGIAMLKYRLYDIDLLINRTLVYGALTAMVVALYVLVVGALSAVFQTNGSFIISLLATGLVAVLFQPVHERLQRAVNRLMYGERDDPYAVISRLGRRMEDTLTPDAVLLILVETVAQALKLPYVAIALATTDHRPLTTDTDQNRERAPEGSTENRGLGDGYRSPVLGSPEAFAIVASSGTPVDKRLILPLVYQGETIGQLLLAPRAPGEAFSPADHRLLDDLARQAGVAVHAVRLTTDLQRLTADLQRSRERLVTTREEERRRLRRDLHDGLGPTLASLAQRIDTARGLVPRDPDAATALLSDLKTQIKATIAEIRRVAYALRPPALDELGLVPALREHAAHYDQANGLRVSLEAPEELSLLPAAVEVAAYRIVLEALTNVARHAHAQRCRIRLSLADALCLEIIDDGSGLPVDCRAGVGLTAMRERAAELGGVCRIEPGATGGTHVWARLPLLPPEV